jgi:putative oxidoreductase
VLAWPIFLAELAGGLAIVAGFYGRYVSAALLPVLIGALFIHAPNGWLFTAAGGGWEYPAFLAVAALTHVLVGDGAFALRPAALPLPAAAPSPRAA